MARLPDIAGEAQQPVPQPSAGVASYEPPNWRQVGMAGQVISGAGRDMEEAANTVAMSNERQDAITATAAANRVQQARITREFDPNTGFRNAKEGQAVGQRFLDTYTQGFSDDVSAARSTLENDDQRRMFDQHAQVQGLQFKSALLQHQAAETDKFNDSTANSTIDLSLRTMAQKPTDELNFQTGLAQINGTIDATGRRKGMPPEQVAELKGKYLDAAYSTRITSIMDGIPGVAQANPYAAEKLFKQVQDQLGPASQVHLAKQVQKSIQSVQERDIAQAIIFGGRFPAVPSVIQPALGGAPPLQAIVQGMESGGNPDAVSPKGASGAMQVMPATAANPGYGVRPAALGADGKPQAGELERVGRDYLGAMSARYGDPALTMAAYNAGPGVVDQWLQKNGDPRAGQISMQDWVAKIPFAETQKYVTEGLHRLNAAGGHPDAPIQAPTANVLKTDLYARVMSARHLAEQQYPGDTAYADAVASRVENYGRMVISNQQGMQASAADAITAATNGTKPDGSDAPVTLDQLLADPDVKRSWDQATPQFKATIQREFASGVRAKVNPALFNALTKRIYLPDGDPQKITQPGQITEFMGNGLTFDAKERLLKEMTDAADPKTPFNQQIGNIKATAHKMLTAVAANQFAGPESTFAIQHPELAEEAAYRFGFDLNQRVAAAYKAGKSPQSLFTPGSPDYVLSPAHVASFMPTASDFAARKAAALVGQGGKSVPRLPGETPDAYLKRVGAT